MEKHPDCQPRCAVAVNRRYNDDANGDEDLESKWIDGSTPPLLFHRVSGVNPCPGPTGDIEEVGKPLFL